MNTRVGHDPCERSPGFTLLELLLATAIFAIVVVAINTVFFAAMRWRRAVTSALDESVPVRQALQVLRKDLLNTVSPNGVLAGHFRFGGPGFGASTPSLGGTPNMSATTASGSSTANLGMNQAVQGGLDFFTATGVIKDYTPGADIQEVNYQLVEPLDSEAALGRDLARSVTRNLLAFANPTAEQQRILHNVENLTFEFFDGNQWREIWDTTTSDTALPLAVRVRLLMALDRTNEVAHREPIEMIVRLNSIPSATDTNSTAYQ